MYVYIYIYPCTLGVRVPDEKRACRYLGRSVCSLASGCRAGGGQRQRHVQGTKQRFVKMSASTCLNSGAYASGMHACITLLHTTAAYYILYYSKHGGYSAQKHAIQVFPKSGGPSQERLHDKEHSILGSSTLFILEAIRALGCLHSPP